LEAVSQFVVPSLKSVISAQWDASRSPHVWFLKKSTVCLDAIKIMCYNYSLCDTIKED
jgi:hypothetical protein